VCVCVTCVCVFIDIHVCVCVVRVLMYLCACVRISSGYQVISKSFYFCVKKVNSTFSESKALICRLIPRVHK